MSASDNLNPTGSLPDEPRPPSSANGLDTVVFPMLADGSAGPGRLGEYVLLGELGRGGMGIVYRAQDPHLKREVAVKVMLPQLATNPQARTRFLREARAQAMIEHHHVVSIYQVNEQDGVPYLVMPLLKGRTLHAALQANPRLPLPEVVRIARQIAEGLAAAHELGLVHRDIKPANLWLEAPHGLVKILDFGLARIVDGAAESANTTGLVTQEGAVLGSPAYMSPEQGRGLAVDVRTDLWSLGVVLYQMMTGELPFKGPTQLAMLTSLALDAPSAITKNPAVPRPLADLVLRLLSKAPAGRPPSAKVVAEELQAIERGFADQDGGQKDSQPSRGFNKWVFVPVLLLSVAAIVGFVLSPPTKTPVEVVTPTPQPSPDNPPQETIPQPRPVIENEKEPDRRGAEYALSIGGTVRVHNEDRDIKAVGELPQEPFTLRSVNFEESNQVTDAGLASFKGCKNLLELYLYYTQVGDAGLANFQDCQDLAILNLDATKVTDVGLAHFKVCQNLTQLHLYNTQVSDVGLANFKECKNLASINLDATKVTDAGLAYFKHCKNLSVLRLNNTEVGDAGLKQLVDTSLTFLDVKKTKVTEAGVKQLAAALPECKIEWDGGIIEPTK